MLGIAQKIAPNLISANNKKDLASIWPAWAAARPKTASVTIAMNLV